MTLLALPPALPRILKPGMVGNDVLACKRALKAWAIDKHYPTQIIWPVGNNEYNDAMARSVEQFRYHHAIRSEHGYLGNMGYGYLRPFFDGYGRYLMRHAPKPPPPKPKPAPSSEIRQRARAQMDRGLQNAAAIGYPPQDRRGIGCVAADENWAAGRFAMAIDCSQASRSVLRTAGAWYPGGSDWPPLISNDDIYTGDWVGPHHREEINVWELEVGDAVVYGPGTGQHIALVYDGAGSGDPRVWSHGWSGGPQVWANSYERTFHTAPTRFYRSA